MQTLIIICAILAITAIILFIATLFLTYKTVKLTERVRNIDSVDRAKVVFQGMLQRCQQGKYDEEDYRQRKGKY